jgi:UDP:flavonoid glycosyltransferase YjiC (YdhE family)
MHPLQIAAEHAGLPYVSVLLSHAAVPSEFSHPLGIPLGRIGNRFLWRLTRFALNRTIKHYPDRLRRQLGLPLTRDIVSEVWLSRYLTLVAVSPQICRRQADWPASTQVCGFLNMPNGELDGALPESLAAFLAAGEAPIYMTYGSWMPGDLPGQTRALQMLTQAARLANCRAIIQCPSWEACGLSSSDQILYVSTAPHQKIFPHCFAVLHHGGAGTTQTATLAGKPSIVVANISEQEHWGHELHRLGIASKPNRRRSVSAASLASQIRTLRTTPGMAEKARATADAMRHENGVAEAVKWIGQKCREREAVSQ